MMNPLFSTLFYSVLKAYPELVLLVVDLAHKFKQGDAILADYVASNGFKLRLVRLIKDNQTIIEWLTVAVGLENHGITDPVVLVELLANIVKLDDLASWDWLDMLSKNLDESCGVQLQGLTMTMLDVEDAEKNLKHWRNN